MEIEKAQGLIEKSILSGKQIEMEYTNLRGETKTYRIATITSTWDKYFKAIVEAAIPGGRNPFRNFRYDRISKVDITNNSYQPGDHLIEKIRDGSLFSSADNGLDRQGGIKGYPSSINYVSEPRLRLQREEAEKLIGEIDISPIEGWDRGFVWSILDGDTFELYLETSKSATKNTRLYGADAPEFNENYSDEQIESSSDFILGLEAKVFVEDMFKKSRYCYVKDAGIEAYRRHLMHVMNADGENVGLELLKNGLAVPMMAYFEDEHIRDEYIAATQEGFENKKGVWGIEEISDRYNNIMSATEKTEISLLGHIPVNTSAIDRYLRQNPKAKLVYAALNRKISSATNRKSAEQIFEIIMEGIDPSVYDIEAFKVMCIKYLEEIDKVDQAHSNPEAVKDCIMHIEEMLDELDLGDGPVKGNFSKGEKKLVYHHDPENRWYQLCIPEIKFRTVEDAKYCKFKK